MKDDETSAASAGTGRARRATVLLADDHPLFRAGVRQVLEATGRFEVVAEARDGDAALAQIEMLLPDYAVIDLSMPGLNGLAVLERVALAGLPTRVLMLSMHADRAFALRARDHGAIGYVAKEDAASELIAALDTQAFFMSDSVGARDAVAPPAPTPEQQRALGRVTPAERRILQLLAEGHTSKAIGRTLGISPRTVQAHRRNIAEKLHIAGPNQVMAFAMHNRALLEGPEAAGD